MTLPMTLPMTLHDALLLFTVCLAAMVSPGPGVAAVVARGAACGWRRALGFIAGIVIGDLVLFTAAAIGLAALAATWRGLLSLLAVAGGLWLVVSGLRLWRDIGHGGPAADQTATPIAGLLMTLGNPKAVLFYLALLPAILGPGPTGMLAFTESALIVALTLTLVMTSYAVAGQAAARALAHPLVLRRLCATIMIGAGLFVLGRAGLDLLP